jgi:hypothetical protein
MTLYELTGDFIKLIDTKKEIDDNSAKVSLQKQIVSDMNSKKEYFK